MKGIKPILEHVLIEDGWNMPCIICKDGTTYAMLKRGKYISRSEWLSYNKPLGEDSEKIRLALFDKLDAYYLEIKDK